MKGVRRFLKGMLWGTVVSVLVGDFIKLPGSARDAFLWVVAGSIVGGILRWFFGEEEAA